jgi:hypothetical protein
MNDNYIIVLINYNNWQDTIECINSLKNSGVKGTNILIIENCSHNDSLEKLKIEAPGIKLISTNKNLGFTGGNNIGLKYALEKNYDYAILLNNDTIVEGKDSIKVLISVMDKHSDVTLGTGRIFYYPDKDKIWYNGGKLIKWRGMAVHFNYRQNKNEVRLNTETKETDFISGCFMCIRLRDLPKLGYLDENFFMYLDDIEYSVRAVKSNLKLLYVPEVVIYHKAVGEEKRTPNLVYYSIRNRRLLINLHFGIISKIYFELVLILKRMLWFVTNKKYYNLLVYAIRDYKNRYFGQAPESIK